VGENLAKYVKRPGKRDIAATGSGKKGTYKGLRGKAGECNETISSYTNAKGEILKGKRATRKKKSSTLPACRGTGN